MSTQTIERVPTEKDIKNLEKKLDEAKRIQEHENLKADIASITDQIVNTPNEFQGAIQVPDTERVLKTKRKLKNFTELMISRFTRMLSARPIIGNLIAIGLGVVALTLMKTEIILQHFDKWQHYLGIGVLIVMGWQVIKSASRSILIPLVAAIAGAIISNSLPHGQTFLTYGVTFYQYMMVAGLCGIVISIFTID